MIYIVCSGGKDRDAKKARTRAGRAVRAGRRPAAGRGFGLKKTLYKGRRKGQNKDFGLMQGSRPARPGTREERGDVSGENRRRGMWEQKYKRLVMVAGLVLVLDQVTKAMVLQAMPLYHSVVVIPGFFNLTHIHNPGGAFGFLAAQGAWVRQLFFVLLSSLAIVLIFYFYVKTPPGRTRLSFALALVLGGPSAIWWTVCGSARWSTFWTFTSARITGRPSISPTAPSALAWEFSFFTFCSTSCRMLSS